MTEYRSEARITLNVNGRPRSVVVTPGDTLLHVLRRGLGLTGTKLGCENGDCGACTVQVNGVPVKSCYTLAVDVDDADVSTIESLHDSPAQRAFVEENGFQCGYCTPGFVMNADALVQSGRAGDPAARREWMESNICRCTGYEGIERAVIAAAREAAGDADHEAGGAATGGRSGSADEASGLNPASLDEDDKTE